MAKRTLPQRSTRGQLPSHLKDPSPPLNQTQSSPRKHSRNTQRKEIENKLKSQQILNLRKYPFCRAVHYFYPLDDFPRLSGHVSYAVDHNNALGNTFPRDKQILNQASYGDVLNRKLFGLPIGNPENFGIKKENRCKNVAYSYLNQIEDKKYQIDRQISALKVVLSKLQKGSFDPRLKQMDFFKKDQQLSSIFAPETSIEQKIALVEDRLQSLRVRKEFNSPTWLTQDKVYFYYALDQKLHNIISDLKSNIQEERLVSYIFESHFLKHPPDLQYYNTKVNVVSFGAKLRKTAPLGVFHFEGGLKVLNYAFQAMARKSESLGETTFYEVKQMVKNIFNYNLVLKQEKMQNYANYTKLFRKRCDEIKKTSLKPTPVNQLHPKLDKYLSKGDLSFGTKVELSGRQYILMVIFYWLCLGFTELLNTLENFPDLFSLISSEYFPKVFSFLVSATNSPLVGMLCAALQALSDLFSRPDPFLEMPIRLLFQFNEQISVGLLFREDLQVETEPSGRCQTFEEEGRPSKKIKFNDM